MSSADAVRLESLHAKLQLGRVREEEESYFSKLLQRQARARCRMVTVWTRGARDGRRALPLQSQCIESSSSRFSFLFCPRQGLFSQPTPRALSLLMASVWLLSCVCQLPPRQENRVMIEGPPIDE